MTPLPRTMTFTIPRASAAASHAAAALEPGSNRIGIGLQVFWFDAFLYANRGSTSLENAMAFSEQGSGHALDRVAQDRNHIVDMAFLDDQRRRHRIGVAAQAEIKTAIDAIDHDVIARRSQAVV